jgi:hypothetical protein
MASRFVMIFGCPSLPLHEPLLFPRAFELLASLRARPIALISRALLITKFFCTFACRSMLLLLTTSLMGVNAAAPSTDGAGPGLCWCDGIPCVGICLVCPHKQRRHRQDLTYRAINSLTLALLPSNPSASTSFALLLMAANFPCMPSRSNVSC